MATNHFSEEDIEKVFHDLVYKSLRDLFETKHLYQSVTIDPESVALIEQRIEQSDYSPQSQAPTRSQAERAAHKAYLKQIITSPWNFTVETWSSSSSNLPDSMEQILAFDPIGPKSRNPNRDFSFGIPTIRVACNFCDGVLPPHNSGFLSKKTSAVYATIVKNGGGKIIQVFAFPFQCQNCKDEPIFYLVHRQDLKFTIAGRSRMAEVNIPKSLPREESKYFRDAIIGHTAGQTLAALFLLRVFIEQYMRRVTHTTEKIKGEVLADKYSLLLDNEFPPRFRTLKKVYGVLSDSIHSADASEEKFVACKKDIENHFEQLEFFPLLSEPRVSEPSIGSA